MTDFITIPLELMDADIVKFGAPIPVSIWGGTAAMERAFVAAQAAANVRLPWAIPSLWAIRSGVHLQA